MFKRFKLLALLMGFAASAVAQPTQQAPLEIGIFPYLSTRALLSTYQPLQQFLEQKLHRRVHLVTAPDMRTFVGRTQEGVYNYVVTAPHFARLAQMESGYRPLLRANRNLAGVLLVRKDSSIRNIEQLRGKIVVTPDSLAIISLLGVELFKRNGLIAGKDVIIQSLPTHSAAVVTLQNGAADAAVVSPTAFLQMTPEQRAGLSVIAQTAEVPHVMFLASAKVNTADADAFVLLLRQFTEHTAEGKQFIESLGYQGLRAPTEQELRSLDPYLDMLKADLAKAR